MAELVNLVAFDAADAESPEETSLLAGFMRSNMFQNFLRRQSKAAEEAERRMNPNKEGMTAEIYFSLSKDLRLVSRFWLDLLHFAEDWKPTVDNGDDYE